MPARTISFLCGSILAIWAALAIPGVQASGDGLAAFTGIGSGLSAGALSTCPAGLCPGTDSCVCVPITGTGKASAIGNVNFSTTVVLDGSLDIGNCDETFGTLTLASKSKAINALVLDYTGTVCAAGAAFVLNAAYYIDGTTSTGKYAGATGSGNLAGSENGSLGILGNVNGTLLP
jgi:hypothetical protein